MNGNIPPEELASVFTDALIEIVLKISGFSFSVLSSEPDDAFGGVIASMNLSGKNGGAVFISAGEPDMCVLCSYIMGVPQEDVTKEDVDDALCELVNMTAGNVRLRFGGADVFTLSTPFAIRGENMSLITKKRVRVAARHLGNESVSIRLKLICGETNARKDAPGTHTQGASS